MLPFDNFVLCIILFKSFSTVRPVSWQAYHTCENHTHTVLYWGKSQEEQHLPLKVKFKKLVWSETESCDFVRLCDALI